ncbi:hypothetical protein CANCADRAFT_4197 [Tortispora caseinolytica NRRL Y-17796]|uniref:Uncharacterized protein n=1 Tax=Tortispora caseinolytica NRRL Y-17796 TaxID=767744 RepID=A0A1E4TCW3_9ASCO|nr:hypothetical protein CANCADRAFT_4197 [Tortispora caseinolytica NRRL Y-17796]
MAEKDFSEYRYEAMSNKVIKADKRLMDDPAASADQTSTEPETLVGRIGLADMGARVARDKPPTDKQSLIVPKIGTHHLDKSLDALLKEYAQYRPLSAKSRDLFASLMVWVRNFLGDVSEPTLVSAADAILAIAKNINYNDSKRKSEICAVIGSDPSDDDFSSLYALTDLIRDYDHSVPVQHSVDTEPDLGVALVFEDDNQNDEDTAAGERSDSDSDSTEVLAAIEPDIVREQDEKFSKPENVLPEQEENMLLDSSADQLYIPPQSIDAFWIHKQLRLHFTDAHLVQDKAEAILNLLSRKMSPNRLQVELLKIFDRKDSAATIVKQILTNRWSILYRIKLARAATEEEVKAIKHEVIDAGHGNILQDVTGSKEDIEMTDVSNQGPDANSTKLNPQYIDLSSLVFEQGGHLITNKDVRLPKGSFRVQKKKYEEVHVPAPQPREVSDSLVPISDLPQWSQASFSSASITHLNYIQSQVLPVALGTDENLLMCAPTGAGKTNVALLAMLRTIQHYRNSSTGEIDRDAFKIVYIAPLKALVQEQVRTFSARLAPFGLTCAELTGDQQLTRDQIALTNVIFTTPEKWDIVTRKANETSYVKLVRLLIIDEIHLLHDERGPVLESIVARALMISDLTGTEMRMAGLSATLPNYSDVSTFLRVDPAVGLFYFDASFRPCPLSQQVIGITEKKPVKVYQAMNDATFAKVTENAGKHQMIIFTHSRKDTVKTAKFIRDKAIEEELISKILRSDNTSQRMLKEKSEDITNTALKELVRYGFGTHHAGMNAQDRAIVEELFAAGYVQVLVSTATLAWGVNLPAHTVIIKGTQIYSPGRGQWVELSPQDVIQMMGRAGRPGFDTSGEGIIITTHNELQYYLSLLNQQLPIESQFISKLVDALNAEVSLGYVRSLTDAVEWLGYTYLFVRMVRSRRVYHVGPSYDDDTLLERYRLDLAHSAATILHKDGLLRYNSQSGNMQPTELGRIAANYYVTCDTMREFNRELSPVQSHIELIKVFSKAEEFKFIPVRPEEQVEIRKLMDRVPFPVSGETSDRSTKISILLQAYISRLSIEGFALLSDMIYVTQSAARLFRAMFEMCVRKAWGSLSRSCLDICKMIEKRLWHVYSPIRQYPGVPMDVIRRMEALPIPWYRYFELESSVEVGEALNLDKYATKVFELLKCFPRAELQVQVQPITPTTLKFEVLITPNFTWNEEFHGKEEAFHLFVEDSSGDELLYSDMLFVYERFVGQEHVMEFTVPIASLVPPNYFVSLISDRWIGSQTRVPVSFKNLLLPRKFLAPTPLIGTSLVSIEELEDESAIAYCNARNINQLNSIQSEVFNTVYRTNRSCFIGMPSGSDDGLIAELAIMKHLKDAQGSKIVYMNPVADVLKRLLLVWKVRLPVIDVDVKIGMLTGDLTIDQGIIASSSLVLTTPQHWAAVSCRWQRNKNIHNIRLFIADRLQSLNEQGGSVYECMVSRMKLVAQSMNNSMRIVGLGYSIATGGSIKSWMELGDDEFYNFAPSDRVQPLAINLKSFTAQHHDSLMLNMALPVYLTLAAKGNEKVDTQSILFVDSRLQAFDTAHDLQRYDSGNDQTGSIFSPLLADADIQLAEKIDSIAVKNLALKGIGIVYGSMSASDRGIVEKLYNSGMLQILLCSRDARNVLKVKAGFVIIMGIDYYEGSEHRYKSYSISELMDYLAAAYRFDGTTAKALVMCRNVQLPFLKKFLSEAIPVESSLNLVLSDYILPEICNRIVKSKQDAIDWITHTFFYRRLLENPSYYGLLDATPDGLSAYLSELVEGALDELKEMNIVEIDESEDVVSPLEGALISGHYGISPYTINTLQNSLGGKLKLRKLLETICLAVEFDALPLRQNEDAILKRLQTITPMKSSNIEWGTVNFKAFMLIQAHISRIGLPQDLAADQRLCISESLKLLYAAVDVLSSAGYLTALRAIDLVQMIVQAVWSTESALEQIPHFTNDIIARCHDKSVNTVYDIMYLEDEERDNILQIDDEKKMSDIAMFVNKYPNIDISAKIEEPNSIVSDTPCSLEVTVERDTDEEEDDVPQSYEVYAPFFTQQKIENWWIVAGNDITGQLYGIKRVRITKPKETITMQIVFPTEGQQNVNIYCMSDSYIGADKQTELMVNVLSD